MGRPRSIFKNFNGAWKLSRTITPGAIMLGEALFEVVSPFEYVYRENGSMTLEDGTLIEDVTRAYHYKFIDDQIHVHYADGPDSGKLFHVLELLNANEAEAEHLCGEDLYRTHYVFNFPESFTIQHDVNGPKKDYTSKTIFTRLDKS